MKKHHIYIALLLAMLVGGLSTQAQMLERNDLIYNSYNMPQANGMNPAFFPQTRNVYISLPYTNISVGLPLCYSDLNFTYNETEERYDLNVLDITQTLADNRRLHLAFGNDLLGFGFRAGKLFFNFNAGVRSDFALNFNENIHRVLKEGFINQIGEENRIVVDADELLHLQAYERFSIGMGYNANKLAIGMHVNILNGVLNAYTDNTRLSLYASDNAYSTIYGELNYRVMRSDAFEDDIDASKLLLNSGNMGLTFDLGFKYTFSHFVLSASIIDLGPGIHWTKNVKYTESENKSFQFSGADLTELFSGGEYQNDYANKVADTIANIFNICDKDGEDYWYGVPTRVYLGGSYIPNNFLRLNLLYHGEWDNGIFYTSKGHYRSNLSISASLSIKYWLDIMVANALAFDGKKGSIINPGAGITITPGNALQLFCMVDYISNFYAVDIKGVNLQFGMNILFGNNPHKKAAEKNNESNYQPIIL